MGLDNTWRGYGLNIVVGLMVLVLLAAGNVGATPNEEWRKSFRNSEMDQLFKSVQQTKDGGYVVTGSTRLYWNNKYGSYDALIIKTDENGNQQWSKTYGGLADDGAVSILQSKDGGYIILGWTESYGAGGSDVWVIKINKNGEQEWSRTFGGTSADEAFSIQQTMDEGYIITGYILSVFSPNTWIIKTDKDGYLQWNKSFSGRFNDVKLTLDGGYTIAGFNYSNTWKIGSKREYLGANARLIKTDANGNEQWNRAIGREGYSDDVFVQQTLDGGYALAGNGWLVKTDAKGNEQWNKIFGRGTKWDRITSFQLTLDDGYIIAGSTNAASDEADTWLIKIDANGNQQWNKTFGRNINHDTATSVWQTSDGGYIVSVVELTGGFIKQGTGIDEKVGLIGNRGGWLIKVKGEQTETTIVPTANPTEKAEPAQIPTAISTEKAIITEAPTIGPTEKTTGFEIVLAITILLAVYICRRKRR